MRRTVRLILLVVWGGSVASAADVVIPAGKLSARSGNVAPRYAQFGDLTLCVGQGGFMEWRAELEAGPYYVHFLYASGQRRPCRLSINGRQQPREVLGQPTGGFMPEHLRWETCGPFEFRKGNNSIRIATGDFMPHLRALAVCCGNRPPQKGVPGDVEAEAEDLPSRLNLGGLRRAVSNLAETYPQEYPHAEAHLARRVVRACQPARREGMPASGGIKHVARRQTLAGVACASYDCPCAVFHGRT